MSSSASESFRQNGLFLIKLLHLAFPRTDHLLDFADVLEPNTSVFLGLRTTDDAASTYVERLQRTGSLNLLDSAQIIMFVGEIFLHAKTVTWEEIRALAQQFAIVLDESAPARPADEIKVILDSPGLSLCERHAFISALSGATGYAYQVERYRVAERRTHLTLRSSSAGKSLLQRMGRAHLSRITGRPVRQVLFGGSVLALSAAWFAHNAATGAVVVMVGATTTSLVAGYVDIQRMEKTVEQFRQDLEERIRENAARTEALLGTRQAAKTSPVAQEPACPEGQIQRGEQGCVSACADGTTWNSALGCVAACNAGTTWRLGRGCASVCGPGLRWEDEFGCVQQCAQGETWTAERGCTGPSKAEQKSQPAKSCEIPIDWKNVTAGFVKDYPCRFPEGTRVQAVFEGYPEVTSTIDNKIWNASIEMTLQSKDAVCAAPGCRASHGVPFGTAPDQWSLFRMVDEAVVPKNGIVVWNLKLGLCQTGQHQGACSLRSGSTLRIEPIG